MMDGASSRRRGPVCALCVRVCMRARACCAICVLVAAEEEVCDNTRTHRHSWL